MHVHWTNQALVRIFPLIYEHMVFNHMPSPPFSGRQAEFVHTSGSPALDGIEKEPTYVVSCNSPTWNW